MGLLLNLVLWVGLSNAQLVTAGHLELKDISKDQPNAMAIELKGAIAAPMADEFARLLLQIPEGKILYLNLDSEGGELQEGLRIIELLQAEKAKGRKIVTIVFNGEACASMCVPIYLQGEERIAYEVSTFMFHGTYQAGITNVPNFFLTKNLQKYFLEAGVSASWLQTLWDQGVFSDPGEYWLSGRELVDQKSGVVTKLKSRHRRPKPRTLPFDPMIRPR